MVDRLHDNIVDLIREGENERVIMRAFDGAYRRWRVFPPKKIYWTLLCCSAIKFDHKDLVRHLLETGFDLNYTGTHEFDHVTPPPLNIAVHFRREDCIKMLLNAGARVDVEEFLYEDDVGGHVSALELAVMVDCTDLVKLMIPLYDRKRTRTKMTPLHLACLHGARQCLDYILSTVEGQNCLTALDSDDPLRPEGYSLLMLGVHHGEWLVQRILEAGGNAKHVTRRSKLNVLHVACSLDLFKAYNKQEFFPRDLPKIIELFIESGCDPNVSSSEGETPLSRLAHLAFRRKAPRDKRVSYDFAINREVVLSAASLLLDHGANPDGDIRVTPLSSLLLALDAVLEISVRYGDVMVLSLLQATILTRDLFRLLLSRSASPNIICMHCIGSNYQPARHISGFIVDGLFEALLYHCSPWFGLRSQDAADIVSVIADVFRLLLLFGGKLHEPTLLFKVYEHHVPGGSLFLTYYLNFGGRPDIELHMKRYHMQLNTVETHLTELEVFIQRQPILLKNMARIAILRNVGSPAMRSVPALKLPTALTDYILSLE